MSTEEELALEIRVLTSALNGHSLPVVSPILPTQEHLLASLRAYTHLSSMLCLGTKACPAVAVTGTLENDLISVLVLANSGSSPTALKVVPPIEGGPALFTVRGSTSAPPLLRHAQLCHLGLRLMATNKLKPHAFHVWLISVGFSKIRARLRSLASRWDSSEGIVVDVLRKFQASHLAGLVIDGKLELPPRQEVVEKVRQTSPELVKPTTNGDTVVNNVTTSNAVAWICLFAEGLAQLGKMLSVVPFVKPPPPPDPNVPGPPPFHLSAVQIHDIHDWMVILRMISNCEIISEILSVPFFTFNLKRKLPPSAPSTNNISTAAEHITEDNTDEEGAENSAEEDAEDTEGTADDAATSGHVLLRQVRTLGTWLDGINFFLLKPRLAQKVAMQVAWVTPPTKNKPMFDTIYSKLFQRAMDTIQDGSPNDSKTSEHISKLDKDFVKPSDNSAVHCEASIMALLFNKDPALITSSVTAWSIGVSRKCCWSCWRLAELLQVEGAKFALNGTHKIIFGWAPPAGIPTGVLRRMRDELLTSYIRVCTDALMALRSPQTSPVSPTAPFHDDQF